MYSCPGCGSQMVFDIPTQGLKCGRCDRTMTVQEADEKEARTAGSSFSVDLMTCPTCGAEIRALNTAATAFCSYCGSSVMMEAKEAEFDPQSSLIPFQTTREQCFEKYQEMLKKSFCADHRLKNHITPDSFRGIYVPYHVYKASAVGTITLEGSETKGNDTYYYNTDVALDHHYTGILHDASKEMPDSISEHIVLSRDCTDKFRPFSPAYLSGFYADVPDTDPDRYLDYARSEAIRKGLEDTMPALKDDSAHYSVGSAEKKLLEVAHAEHIGDTMLPVWFMSMRSGNRMLYAVQNAVTGEMWADIPMDISRFGLVAAALAAVLFLLFSLKGVMPALRPEMVMIVAMLLAIFAQVAVNSQRTKIRDQEIARETAGGGQISMKERLKHSHRLQKRVRRQQTGNAGRYLSAAGIGVLIVAGMNALSAVGNPLFYKAASALLAAGMAALVFAAGPKKSKVPPGSIAALAAMAAGALILILDPFRSADLPVYLVCFAILAAVIWECVDLLQLYNRGCSNPVPQFESHTGGEDRA